MSFFKITLYSVKLNILRSKQQQHISSRNTLLPWPPSEHSRNCPPIGQSQSHVTKPDPPVFSQTLIGNSWEEGPKICKLFAHILNEWKATNLTIVGGANGMLKLVINEFVDTNLRVNWPHPFKQLVIIGNIFKISTLRCWSWSSIKLVAAKQKWCWQLRRINKLRSFDMRLRQCQASVSNTN